MHETTHSTIERTMSTKVLPALPAEFQQARVFWSGVAGRVEFWVEADTGAGWQRVELPSNVSWFVKSELSRLRSREGTGERGQWISVLVELAPGQTPVIHENFDTRVYWGSHNYAPFNPPTDGAIVPDDAMYQHFFATRTPEQVPSWAGGATPEQSPRDRLFAALRDVGEPPAWIATLPAESFAARLAATAMRDVERALTEVAEHRVVDELLGEDAVFDRELQGIRLGSFVDCALIEATALLRSLSDDDAARLWQDLPIAVPGLHPAETDRVAFEELARAAGAARVAERFGVAPE